MTGIVKVVFKKTNECYISYSRKCENILNQLEQHVKDESKKNTTRLHDLIEEFGIGEFSYEVIKQLPEGTTKELLEKEKLKAIKEHNPSLNSYKDKEARITTPLEEVMKEISSFREELKGEDNGVIASMMEKEFQDLKENYLNPIYDKLRELVQIGRKDK